MQGSLVFVDNLGCVDGELPPAGNYFENWGVWYAMTPNGHLANLAAHSVTDHGDGTITVHPSILVSDADGELWHGHLERGVWRAC